MTVKTTGVPMDELFELHQSHLFTVRLWYENLGNGNSEWRGKVKYVLSQEERTFRGCEEIGELIRSLLPVQFVQKSRKA